MRPLEEISDAECAGITHLFCDIDDTMTSDGLLPSSSYEALWLLVSAGVAVIPVTGRPGGWCDLIARQWPVAAVVGENGAFYFSYDRTKRRMNRRMVGSGSSSGGASPGEASEGLGGAANPSSPAAEKMAHARDRVLREVPGTALAADQPYRITDIAIDYCEDVPPLSDGEVRRIGAILQEEGLHYKVSSIHVNFWYGDHNKVSCVEEFVRDTLGGRLDDHANRFVFIGDSPNDEPLFARLGTSIGVANVVRFVEQMQVLPAYVTEGESADGFHEAVVTVLERR